MINLPAAGSPSAIQLHLELKVSWKSLSPCTIIQKKEEPFTGQFLPVNAKSMSTPANKEFGVRIFMYNSKPYVNKYDYFAGIIILDAVIAIVDIVAKIIFVGWKMQNGF